MEKESVIKELSKKIQAEGIQRTKGADTKKGYDTDGYGYQYIVDRLNEVCGNDWGFAWHIIKELEGEYRSGAKFHEITVQIDVWITDRINTRSCVGGHISMSYADALKGAITNGFKKTAAFWGVGRDAYAGTIDEDNQPLPDSMDNVTTKNTKPVPVAVPEKKQDDPKVIEWRSLWEGYKSRFTQPEIDGMKETLKGKPVDEQNQILKNALVAVKPVI
jgi:hypothetical protein